MGTRHGALATVTLIAMALLGCSAAPGGPEADQSASAQQQRDFPAVYAQQVDWRECGPEFGLPSDFEQQQLAVGEQVRGLRCTMIAAPLDWDDPQNAETIEIFAVHIPSTGDAPIGTLLMNPGGPGLPGADFATGTTGTPGFAAVHQQYDLLGFDPRGIGRSTPVECPEDTSIPALRYALCAEAIPLVNSMGSGQVARDMDLMRHLVGDKLLHYAGFSYGTVLGSQYATLFPERVGRILLDSPMTSDWASALDRYQQAEAFSRSLTEFVSGCSTEFQLEICPMHDETSLRETYERLDAAPLIATNGQTVSRTSFYEYLSGILYTAPPERKAALRLAGLAVTGDQAAIDTLAATMADSFQTLNFNGLIVSCLSAPPKENLAELYRYIHEYGLPHDLGGPEVTDERLRGLFSLDCNGLPGSGRDYLPFTNTSGVPILILAVTGDHATPYAGAQTLLGELGDARLATLHGSGHIASFQGRSRCADDIATAYLLRGELPAEGTICQVD